MLNSMNGWWLIDALATAILIFDGKLQLVAVNMAGENLLSASARKVEGLSIDELLQNPAITQVSKWAVKNGQSLTERDVELIFPGRDPVCVDCTITPLTEQRSKAALVLEIVNVERHRRVLREETQMVQQHVTRALMRGFAHEIKNPLGGIRGAAQLLERQLTDVSQKEYTALIMGEVDRLLVLLDRMLGPGDPQHPRQVNIHEVLEYVRGLVSVETTQSGLTIKRDYDPSLPPITADRDQLIQVLLNIVRNAVQALAGQGEITLRTRAQRQFTINSKRHKLTLRIDIIDNGPGVPEGIKDDIFYPLVTGRAEGTGLGLSIAQSLIHNLGGIIECNSRPGETVFSIWLPVEGNKR